jgi:hypothetical protein
VGPALACRFCAAPVTHTFVDLGASPLANSYLRAADLSRGEIHYPLHAYVCASCHLVQLGEFQTPEQIFGDYAYFSSVSPSWLAHARAYVERVVSRFGLDGTSKVVEIASNDGYLLRWLVERGVPVLGVEPAANVAETALAAGIPTEVAFFGTATAQMLADRNEHADLMVANNVLAHVPKLNDFVEGFHVLMRPLGVATFEFPHLLRLIEDVEFDTIYHEHFSYFSLMTVERVMAAHGLRVFDVDELPTHGGSLRIYVCHEDDPRPREQAVDDLSAREAAARLTELATYSTFGERVRALRDDLLEFLISARREGKRVAAYGAPAKGNTLLNYCGLGPDQIEFTVDLSPHKQGLFLPGTRIPIHAPDHVRERKPDFLLILPWNLKDEIMTQMADIRDYGGRFVIPVPHVAVLD